MIFPNCNRHCREQALDRAVDDVTWRCPVKVCEKGISIRHRSFFEKSNLQLWKILGLTYLWCRSAAKSRGLPTADTQHELQIGSEHSIVDWNQYCRDIAVSYFINNQCDSGLKQNLNQSQQIVTWFQITWQSPCGSRHSRNILTSTFGPSCPTVP